MFFYIISWLVKAVRNGKHNINVIHDLVFIYTECKKYEKKENIDPCNMIFHYHCYSCRYCDPLELEQYLQTSIYIFILLQLVLLVWTTLQSLLLNSWCYSPTQHSVFREVTQQHRSKSEVISWKSSCSNTPLRRKFNIYYGGHPQEQNEESSSPEMTFIS